MIQLCRVNIQSGDGYPVCFGTRGVISSRSQIVERVQNEARVVKYGRK